MNKIAICIPIWKRPEVTGFVLNFYNQLKKELQDEMELLLIACGSESEISRKIAQENGFVYIEHDNGNLAQKHNALYLKARDYNPDACLKIDSDSIVGKEFFRYYNRLINEGYDYSGITDIYFLIKDYLCYWGGYEGKRFGEPTGVGRFLSKKLLKKLDWKPFGNHKDQYVDRILTQRIQPISKQIKTTKTSCKEIGAYCIDIKSGEFLTGFSEFVFDEVIELNSLRLQL